MGFDRDSIVAYDDFYLLNKDSFVNKQTLWEYRNQQNEAIQPMLEQEESILVQFQHFFISLNLAQYVGMDIDTRVEDAIEEWNSVENCNIDITMESDCAHDYGVMLSLEALGEYTNFVVTEIRFPNQPCSIKLNVSNELWELYPQLSNDMQKYLFMHIIGRIVGLKAVDSEYNMSDLFTIMKCPDTYLSTNQNLWSGFSYQDIFDLQRLYPIPEVTYSVNWTPALKLGKYIQCGEEYDLAISYSNPAYLDAELRYSIDVADESCTITPKEDNNGATIEAHFIGSQILRVEEIYNDSVVGTHEHEIFGYSTPMVDISSVPVLDEGKMERGEICILNIEPSYFSDDSELDDPQYSYRVLKGDTDVTSDVMQIVEPEYLNRVEIQFDYNDAPGLYKFQTLVCFSDVLFDICEFPLRLMTTPSISYSWDSSVSTNSNRYCLKKGSYHEVTVNYTNESYEEAPNIEISANNSAGYITKLSENTFQVKMNTHGVQELTVSITNEDGSEEEYSIPLYVMMDEYNITLNRSESDGIYYHFEYDWWHPEYSDVYAAVEANEFYFQRGSACGITIQETTVENVAEIKLADHGCYTVTISLMDSESDLVVSEKTFVIINLATIGRGATITYRSSIPEDNAKVGFCPHHQIADDCQQVYDQRFIYSIEYNNNINSSLTNPSVGFYADYEYELRTSVGFAIQDRRLNREWYHNKVFVTNSAQINLLAHWYVFDDTPSDNPDAEWVQYDYYQYLTGYLFWPKNGIYKTNISEDIFSYPIQYVDLGIQNNMAPQMVTPFPYE